MGRARPDLIRVFWHNPPGPRAGVTLVKTIRGREYELSVPASGYLTQIETAAALGVTLMTVNRYVRAKILRGTTRHGISVIPLKELKRFLRERSRE